MTGKRAPSEPVAPGPASRGERGRLSEAELAVLEQRAKELARPLDPPGHSAQATQLLVMRRGEARYAIKTQHLVAVVAPTRLTPVPCAPAFVLGVLNHRGRILAVIELGALLDGEPGGPSSEVQVVVVATDAMTFGLAADSVSGVVKVEANDLTPVAAGDGQGLPLVRDLTGELVGVVDLDAIGRSGRLVVDEHVQ